MNKHKSEPMKITLVEVLTPPQNKDLLIDCPNGIIEYLTEFHPEAFDIITNFVEKHINYGCILKITLPCISFNITIHIKDDYYSKVLPTT